MLPQSFIDQYTGLLDPLPSVALLGIRGYTPLPNSMGVYDDAIVSFINGQIKLFTASVDPGSYYIRNPVNPMGCARLQCGLYWYKLGEHHAKQALTQHSEVTIDRIDKDGVKVGQETGYYGINIHSGGPEYLVGRYSAGCQVIRTSEPWEREWLEFFEPVKKAMTDNSLRKIPYLLVDSLKVLAS